MDLPGLVLVVYVLVESSQSPTILHHPQLRGEEVNSHLVSDLAVGLVLQDVGGRRGKRYGRLMVNLVGKRCR